ncbi:MAG: DEAD/DEAH box helicase [Rickettsiales bacterium]
MSHHDATEILSLNASPVDDESVSSSDDSSEATLFSSFDLPKKLAEALEKMEYSSPTPIQRQAIPEALAGRDILGSAQTGTGKTGAFAIPLVAKLLANPRGSALVLTPTRELAVQVISIIHKMLGAKSLIKAALLIGGESMPKQIAQLRERPRIIVGTPGRINDHLTRGNLMLHDAGFLVLDETDRMLDMGFGVQIDAILKYVPAQRQTLMFSATLPDEIVRMSKNYLKDPVRIAVGDANAPAQNVKQETINVSEAEKYDLLLEQLDKRTGSIIVFVKTKYGADKMAHRLRGAGHDAEAIHGDLQQNKRDRIIRAFRNNKYRIMVATDVAARGLDIPHIEHVINYDLPQAPEDYIHRIGRTARAGAHGEAVSFVSHEDRLKWQAIDDLLNPEEAKARKAARMKQGSPKGRGGFSRRGGNGNRRGFSESDGNRNESRPYAPRREDKAPRNAGSERQGEENRRGDRFGDDSRGNGRFSGERRNDRFNGEERYSGEHTGNRRGANRFGDDAGAHSRFKGEGGSHNGERRNDRFKDEGRQNDERRGNRFNEERRDNNKGSDAFFSDVKRPQGNKGPRRQNDGHQSPRGDAFGDRPAKSFDRFEKKEGFSKGGFKKDDASKPDGARRFRNKNAASAF